MNDSDALWLFERNAKLTFITAEHEHVLKLEYERFGVKLAFQITYGPSNSIAYLIEKAKRTEQKIVNRREQERE